MNTIIDYYEFLLEAYKVDEGIMKSWDDKTTILKVKAFLNRYYKPSFLKNLKNGPTKEKLIKLNDLYTKHVAGKDTEEEKNELVLLGKDFLHKKNKATSSSISSMISYN